MDTYLAAVEAELQSWPGIDHRVERRSKHRSVRLTYGRHQRSVIIPTTGSDHRGPKNTVTQLRRTLKDMGATKLASRPVTKQDEKNAKAVARLGVNNTSVVLSVPKHSPLYERFVKDGQATHYWSFELRAVADPKGTPHLAIVKQPAPTEKMHPGVAKGFLNKPTEAYALAILRGQFKAMDRMGPFASQGIELIEERENELLFKLPANRKPLMVRNKQPDAPAQIAQPEPRPEPEVIRAEATHAPVARHPEPEPAPTAAQPTPLVIQAPKEKVSLEKAINVINAYKEKMGDNLRLSIAEGGYLAAIAKMGKR